MNKKIPKILELYEDYLKSTIKLSNQIMFTLEDTNHGKVSWADVLIWKI